MEGTRYHSLRRAVQLQAGALLHFLCISLLLAICRAEDDESSNDGSDNSQDNESQDYDDGNVDPNEWIDDPYIQADYVRQQLNEEIEAERDAARYNEIARSMQTHDILTCIAFGSISFIGLASAIFCTALFLYRLRVDSLMRRYSREGVVVDGRILAAVPDIQQEMKRANAIDNSAKYQRGDSYSMMTDDESYQIGSRSMYSGSDGSGSNDVEEGQKNSSRHHTHIMEEQEQRHPSIIPSNSAQTSTAKSKQPLSSEQTKIDEKTGKFQTKAFRVIVDYDDVTYHDVINQESSETIRKRLVIMGDDIIETGSKSSDFLVKLHVLQDHPMSGCPCGDVRRAQRWQRKCSFNIYVMIALALVAGGAYAARRVLSTNLFYVYIGLLVLQALAMNCFLDGSFTKIISDKYLENGERRPTRNTRKRKDDKELMIASLKHGTSFSFV